MKQNNRDEESEKNLVLKFHLCSPPHLSSYFHLSISTYHTLFIKHVGRQSSPQPDPERSSWKSAGKKSDVEIDIFILLVQSNIPLHTAIVVLKK